MKRPFILVAGPVRLRRFRRDDLTAFQAYRQDPEIGRFQSWERMDDARALHFIDAVASAPVAPRGEWNQIAIAAALKDNLIGDIGVHVDAAGEEAEIGFTLAPAAQGAGHGVAAVSAMIRYLLNEEGITRVFGVTDVLNTPSARLMERAGMRFVSESPAIFNGAPCIEATWEITA